MPAAKKKSTTVKKAAPKRAPAKASTTKVSRVSRPAKPAMRSFRPAPVRDPFFTLRITHQTLYWLVLALIVLGLGVWVTNISIQVQNIYDQIDETNQQVQNLDSVPLKKK